MIQEEGSIQVTRTLIDAGEEVDKEIEHEKITVRPFLCQPAYVSVKMGETVPLVQKFANRKIDISVSHPCYKEELVSMIEQVSSFVKDKLEEELVKIDNAALKRISKKETLETKEIDGEVQKKKKKKSVSKKSSEKLDKKQKKTEIEDEVDDLDDLLNSMCSEDTDKTDEEDDDLADFI